MNSDVNSTKPGGITDGAEVRDISRRQMLKKSAVVGGMMVWTVPVVQTLDMAAARAQTGSPPPDPEPTTACFLILDDEAIKSGTIPNNFSPTDVNEPIASPSQRSFLPAFNIPPFGQVIDLFSGTVGDEGWFAPQTIPASWAAAGPTTDGLQNFLAAGPGLGSGETLLDNIPDVIPLRAEGLLGLVGETIAAIVRKGDVSINYGPITGNLQGDYLGLIAFTVLSLTQFPGGDNELPVVRIRIEDPAAIFSGNLSLCGGVPIPTSSSDPDDVVPGGDG